MSLLYLREERDLRRSILIVLIRVAKKGRGINNCFLSKFIDFREMYSFMVDLPSRLSRLNTGFVILPQLRLANNREGEKTTFLEISRIVLEITRQIYDERERTEHGARGGLPLSSETSRRKF